MAKKKEKGDSEPQDAGNPNDQDTEYKTKENMKIKELLKKKLAEYKAIDEKFKTKINSELTVTVDKIAGTYDEQDTAADYFTKLLQKTGIDNDQLNEAHLVCHDVEDALCDALDSDLFAINGNRKRISLNKEQTDVLYANKSRFDRLRNNKSAHHRQQEEIKNSSLLYLNASQPRRNKSAYSGRSNCHDGGEQWDQVSMQSMDHKKRLEDFTDPIKKMHREVESEAFVARMRDKKKEWKKAFVGQYKTRLEEWDAAKEAKAEKEASEKILKIQEAAQHNKEMMEEWKKTMLTRSLIDPAKQKEYEETYLIDPKNGGKRRKPLWKQMGQKFDRIHARKMQKKLAVIKEVHKPYDYDALRQHDDRIKSLLMDQKIQRDNKFKLRKKADLELLKDLQPTISVKATIIQNGLTEAVNATSDINIKISIKDQLYLYNFKQKGTKSHIFTKLTGRELVHLEIYDKDEKMERDIPLSTISVKKDNFNSVINLHQINKTYQGSFMVRLDMLRTEINPYKSEIDVLRAKIQKAKEYSQMIKKSNLSVISMDGGDAEEDETDPEGGPKKPLNKWMQAEIDKEKQKAQILERISSNTGIGNDYLKQAVKTIKADREKYNKEKEQGFVENPLNDIDTNTGKPLKRVTQSQKLLRPNRFDPLPKISAMDEAKRTMKKKEAAEYMHEVKKKYNLGEIGENFQKRAKKLPKDQILAHIERLENKARLKEDLARAKGALVYKFNDKKLRGDIMKSPNKEKIMAQLESDLEVEEDIDNMYFDAINAKLNILESTMA